MSERIENKITRWYGKGTPTRVWLAKHWHRWITYGCSMCWIEGCSCSNTNKDINSRFHIGRFDNLPFIYSGPKMLVLKKKLAYFLEINSKWLIIQGVKKTLLSNIPPGSLALQTS